MKTIVSLCCFSEMFMSKGKIYTFFSFENTKVITCCNSCYLSYSFFFLKIQSKLKVCIFTKLLMERVRQYPRMVKILRNKDFRTFRERFWKGFGNTQVDVYLVFLSVKLECIYFWRFSKHRWCLLFLTLISNNRRLVTGIIDVLFQSCSGIRNFESTGALD